jgi:hypothetical protein
MHARPALPPPPPPLLALALALNARRPPTVRHAQREQQRVLLMARSALDTVPGRLTASASSAVNVRARVPPSETEPAPIKHAAPC